MLEARNGDIEDMGKQILELKIANGCAVCGGTGWIQEGWGDLNMDGIPCSACYEEEWEDAEQEQP